MTGEGIFITGSNGQVGRALCELLIGAKGLDADGLDITDKSAVEKFDWTGTQIIINAAAYTNVNGAETNEGKDLAKKINIDGVANLARVAAANDMLFIQYSTAYVYNGKNHSYTEEDEPDPLGEYAKTKLAGDQEAAKVPQHYIIRTDSVVGDGNNFVRTMLRVGQEAIAKGDMNEEWAEPQVVADQFIRPTFAIELALATKFLIENQASYGIYNVTNEGPVVSWADFTRAIYKEAGLDLNIQDTTLAEYSQKPGQAPRPAWSVLDLSKIEKLGFKPTAWPEALKRYLKKEMQK